MESLKNIESELFMKTIYRAFDGEEFYYKEECLEYEKKNTSQVRECVNVIKKFCEMFDECDGSCPFYDEECMCCCLEENPSNW